MTIRFEDGPRRVIPRWRSSDTTALTGELVQNQTIAVERPSDGYSFDQKKSTWEDEGSVAAAAELVGAAFVLGREPEAIGAARTLAPLTSQTTSTVRRISRLVLERANRRGDWPAPSQEHVVVEPTRAQIRHARSRLREEPRNVVLWVDLSRAYAISGLAEKAEAAMRVATGQVRNNRFVLRSASRLLVHNRKPDEAHALLKRREATRVDPWLMAAEIAVASAAGKESKLIKMGFKLLASESFNPFETGELSSALATVEMDSGNTRSARRLFRRSLERPTDNSVAQAGWAARRLPDFSIDPSALATPRSFEAKAWETFTQGRWTEAVSQCREWLRDEQFSTRPAQLGSFVALTLLDDFTSARELVQTALLANPNDSSLLNNLAVAEAELGNLSAAEASLRLARAVNTDRDNDVYLTATEGLLKFRRGEPEIGRALYQKAINLAGARKLLRAQQFATAHLAREELKRRDVADALPLMQMLVNSGSISDADLKTFVSRLEALLKKISDVTPGESNTTGSK